MKRKGTTNAELKSIMERDVLGNAGTKFEKTTMSIESNGIMMEIINIRKRLHWN